MWSDLQADAATALVNDGSDSPGPLGLYLMAGVAVGADDAVVDGYADRLEATLDDGRPNTQSDAEPTPHRDPPTHDDHDLSRDAERDAVAAGGSLTASGGGFAAGERVDVFVLSTPTQVGSTTANAQGVASLTFQVPRTLDPGAHTVELRGASGRVVSRHVHRDRADQRGRLAASGPTREHAPARTRRARSAHRRSRARRRRPDRRPMTRRAVAAAVGALLVAAVTVAAAAPAEAAAYRFWSYWKVVNGAWTFSQVGASAPVVDGAVEGWRFSVSPDSSHAPRPPMGRGDRVRRHLRSAPAAARQRPGRRGHRLRQPGPRPERAAPAD